MRTRLWDGIEEGVKSLDGIEGRRVVFVITDGLDTLSDRPMEDAAKMARKSGVLLYWIGMSGTGGPEPNQQIRGNAGLRSFVEDTGGGYMRFAEIDEINRMMTEVAQELHHQYLLGFTPAVLDNRLHKLDVRVLEKNYTVRARKTYVAEE